MKNKTLLELLNEYVSNRLDPPGIKERFLSFAGIGQNCFERSNTDHITCSAWILDRQSKNKVLLCHHAKLNKWLQPGGHADGDSDVLGVAMKEAQEETGLKSLVLAEDHIFDIDIHHFPDRLNIPAHLHYDLRFKFYADAQEPLVLNREVKDLKWFAFDELPEQIKDASILRMLAKSQNIH